MKTSCIQHPVKSNYIQLHQWQIDACDGSVCAAALLSYFEYRHNWKVEQARKARQYNDTAEKHGDSRTQDESLYIWDTADELAQHVLIYSAKSMPAALHILEDKGFISIHRNPNKKYAFDKTKFFLFHPDAVNQWIDDRQEKQPDRTGEFRTSSPKIRRQSSDFRSLSPENGRAITTKSSTNSSTKSSEDLDISVLPIGDEVSSSIQTPDYWQQVKDLYNTHKPDLWTKLVVMNESRLKALRRYRKELGDPGLLSAIEAACKFAQQDTWWGSKGIDFDNLLRNNHIVSLAERYQAVVEGGGIHKILEDPKAVKAIQVDQMFERLKQKYEGDPDD